MLFMGGVSAVGLLLATTLPETLGAPLVEKLDDVDVIFQNKKPFFAWWGSEKVKEVRARNTEL